MRVGTALTCPSVRMHPAIVAQAAGSGGCPTMSDGARHVSVTANSAQRTVAPVAA